MKCASESSARDGSMAVFAVLCVGPGKIRRPRCPTSTHAAPRVRADEPHVGALRMHTHAASLPCASPCRGPALHSCRLLSRNTGVLRLDFTSPVYAPKLRFLREVLEVRLFEGWGAGARAAAGRGRLQALFRAPAHPRSLACSTVPPCWPTPNCRMQYTEEQVAEALATYPYVVSYRLDRMVPRGTYMRRLGRPTASLLAWLAPAGALQGARGAECGGLGCGCLAQGASPGYPGRRQAAR